MKNKQQYSAPEVEVINARIEKGFDCSEQGLGFDSDFSGKGESQETRNTSNQYHFT